MSPTGSRRTEQEGPAPLRATLGRSARLFAAFRKEQSDPDHFYTVLARDTVAQLRTYTELAELVVLDVGGGPGYFTEELRSAGARCVCLEAEAAEMRRRGGSAPFAAVQGSALELPLRSASVDVCLSSNVLEHVAEPRRMASEMVRVTRPGGLIYLSYTLWWSPWGGHETSPWHYFGGHYAARRYARVHGRPPKNVFGESMFAVSARSMLDWARRCPQAELLDALPRYLPSWAGPVVRIPVLREVVTWNLLLVLRRR